MADRKRSTTVRGRSGPILLVAALGLVLPALAGVETSTVTQTYEVPGTTARELVSYMLRHPFRGDDGAALANIRPQYRLHISATDGRTPCRAERVDVDIRFVITLPRAASEARMSRATRQAWTEFIAFAKRHEDVHEASYTRCAKRFVAAAERVSAASCTALRTELRHMFEQAKRDCERAQASFDRAEKGRLRRLRLFEMAGY